MSASQTWSGLSTAKLRASEVARQQVGRDRVIVATIGGPRCAPAALASGQAHLVHQPLDASPRMPPALPAQFGVDAR